ncbi:MAG: FTR1 family iron permease [Lachnospiraceae bacterium]|nr:FTR1 family iron permease [Lachnospiraceae bacterium]
MRGLRRVCCALLAVLMLLGTVGVPAYAAEECFLTWEEYMAANGVTDWDYNLQAKVISEVANHAVELYKAGDMEQAYNFAKATYWGYYETSGFERNTMNYISGSRVSEVELGFTNFRKSIKKDQGAEEVQKAADHLCGMLVEDGAILSPEGAAAAAGDETAEETKGGYLLDEYFLTWDEYRNAAGIADDGWNYNDMAAAIQGVANHAVELYAAGDKDKAYDFAKATYWGYYETSGFERNTMNFISGSRVSEVELAFTTLRKAVKKDLGVEEVQKAADDLSSKLLEDGMILSPEGPLTGKSTDTAAASAGSASAGTSSSATGVAVFLGSFLIILREGLEAILIVGAIIAYLIKTGNKKAVLPVYIGSALAVVCSFIMAGIFNWLLSQSAEYHMSQEIVEGVAALTAVVVLFWVSNWMVSKSEAAVWTDYIKGKAEVGATRGSLFTLGFTAWLAVFREGAEVILFYQPMLAEDRPDMVWAGFITGVVILVIVFLAIRYLSIKIPLKPFFMGTSILMAVMCVSFLGAGIKELMEGGVFDEMEWALSSPPWLSWIPYNDVLDILGIYPLVGTIVPQIILTIIIIITFILSIRQGAHAKERAAVAEAAAEVVAEDGRQELSGGGSNPGGEGPDRV